MYLKKTVKSYPFQVESENHKYWRWYKVINRIYNKMLDCDRFPARLFDTQLEGGHVGVQLQLSNLNFL